MEEVKSCHAAAIFPGGEVGQKGNANRIDDIARNYGSAECCEDVPTLLQRKNELEDYYHADRKDQLFVAIAVCLNYHPGRANRDLLATEARLKTKPVEKDPGEQGCEPILDGGRQNCKCTANGEQQGNEQGGRKELPLLDWPTEQGQGADRCR